MLKVGLTGGIGCGKTTVSELFMAHDIPVIDADHIAHRLVEPGQPALQQICKVFGTHILNSDGTLNRPLLRAKIFSNPIEKQKLEAILHPQVLTEIKKQIKTLAAPYCIVSIPLLFETDMSHVVDRILVVDCPTELQIERVKQRGLYETDIRAIIGSQASRDYRLNHADDVIDNSGTNSELAEQVKKLHNLYMSISAATGKPSP